MCTKLNICSKYQRERALFKINRTPRINILAISNCVLDVQCHLEPVFYKFILIIPLLMGVVMILLNLPLFMFKLMFLFLSNNFIYMFINIRFNFNIIRVLYLNRWCYLPSQFILYKLSVHLQFFLIYNIVYFFHGHPFFWQHFPLCNYFSIILVLHL